VVSVLHVFPTSFHTSIRPFVSPSIQPSIRPSSRPSIHPSIHYFFPTKRRTTCIELALVYFVLVLLAAYSFLLPAFIDQSIYVYLLVRYSIHPSINRSTYRSMCPFINPSIFRSVPIHTHCVECGTVSGDVVLFCVRWWER